jgi:hypothetical protein
MLVWGFLRPAYETRKQRKCCGRKEFVNSPVAQTT